MKISLIRFVLSVGKIVSSFGGQDRANITEFQMAFFNLSNLLIRSLILKQLIKSLLLQALL